MGLLLACLWFWLLAAVTLVLRESAVRQTLSNWRWFMEHPWTATVQAFAYGVLLLGVGGYLAHTQASAMIFMPLMVAGLLVLVMHRWIRSGILRSYVFAATHPGLWRIQYNLLALFFVVLGILPLWVWVAQPHWR